MKSKMSIILFIPVILLCALFRFYQILVGIDMTSGFFYHDSSFFIQYCYFVLLLISVGIILAFAFKNKKNNAYCFSKKTEELKGRDSLIIGSSFLICAVSMFYSVVELLDAYYTNMFAIFMTGLFSVFMVSIGFYVLYIKEIRPVLGFLMVGVSIYLIVKASWTFLSFMVISSVSERLIAVLMPLVGSIFFLSAGRFFMKKEIKSTRISIIGLGSFAVLLTFSSAISKIIMKLVGPQEISNSILLTKSAAENAFQIQQGTTFNYMYLTSAEDIAFGLLIAVIVIALYTVNKNASDKQY